LSNTHEPVLCQETVATLTGMGNSTVRQGVYVDATFGRGGHSRALLGVLGDESRVVALDRDPAAVAAGREMASSEPRLTICHARFSDLRRALASLDIESVQGVLMDLGVSSPQLDDPHRGFSFLRSGPLDMRMDPGAGMSAAQWLNSASEQEIAGVLRSLGEERYARRIAAAIAAARPISDTGELVALVRAAQPRATPGKHEATRVFQAVRMHVNDELGELESGLRQAFEMLSAGGRLAVIGFHSLEDRMVKRFFKSLTEPPPLPRRLPVRAAAQVVPARSVAGPVRAGAAERARNPRSRSAVLRVVEKIS
jgi:16S rRNA (cytosine1402-N4)-methyltransferase